MVESFDIPLEIIGDAGAGFRHRNEGDEIEREVVIDRAEDLYVGCELLPVLHGQYDAKSSTPASLVVFDFRFQPNRRKKQFPEAHISVVFADEKEPGNAKLDPIVREISFAPPGDSGQWAIRPTERRQEVKRAINLSAGGEVSGLSLTGGASYEIAEIAEKRDSTILEARKRVIGRATGRKNAAEWDLLENGSTKDGIPTFMRVAALLERPKERRFIATVSVDAELSLGSLASGIKRVFGKRRVPIVDPVIFDPGRTDGPVPRIKADKKNLGNEDIQAFSVILKEGELQ